MAKRAKRDITVDRRAFLKGAAAGTAGLAVSTQALGEEDGLAPNAKAQSFPSAEELAGVSFTDTERAHMAEALDAYIDRIRQRRDGVAINNADAPGLVFDPLLKSETYKTQENRVRTGTKPTPLPVSDEDIAFASTVQQSMWIKAGAITSLRLTEIYLERIYKYAPKLECFITVTAELAREQAQKADADLANGIYHGPLHGIPYAVKDLADTKDIRTTWGAMPYKDRVATTDAAIVTRLREAGAVLLGKTTLGALAYGDLWFGGITRNPWNLDEGSSGSSAGSASATAAALASFTIGSETLGSIVSPSSRCGAVGLRPTFGRVPRSGAMALCWSLDKLGPICRSVEDTALILAAINGMDAGDPSSFNWGFDYDGMQRRKDAVIGYDPNWFTQAKRTDRDALKALRDAGYTLKHIKLPDMPVAPMIGILQAEAAAAFEDLTLSGADDTLRWQEKPAWPNTFRAAHMIPAVEMIQCDRLRRKWMKAMADIYRDVDIIISPNFAGDMLTITNYTGSPSLTVPIGFERRAPRPLTGSGDEPGENKRLPHTITLWGNMLREDQLIHAGRTLENAMGLGGARPQLDDNA